MPFSHGSKDNKHAVRHYYLTDADTAICLSPLVAVNFKELVYVRRVVIFQYSPQRIGLPSIIRR